MKKTDAPEELDFYYKLLEQIGTRAALATIASSMEGGKDANVDRATRVFGEWINLDAQPYLARLAADYPLEKYQSRALRGYLRLARQMFDLPEPKLAALAEIAPLAKTDADRKLVADAKTEVARTRRDRALFDGQVFANWEGNSDYFHIEDGVIVAGDSQNAIPRNEFLCTTARYRDFELTLECKIEGPGANAGVQLRSERIPNHHEVSGYQADMSEDGQYWGNLYDESRRNRNLATPSDEARAAAYRPGEWNRYRIICWGTRIKIYLNDALMVDYVEEDPNIPLEGIIGLQIHQGGPSRAFYRNIRIEKFEPRII
ncbi:MAG: DUF1080 domain-containing protein [Thermoguttaceae bacterium]|nr:DUF1080 domain-containing protein [Thermoguttaceae bacterium]